jgi:hypothetical protein
MLSARLPTLSILLAAGVFACTAVSTEAGEQPTIEEGESEINGFKPGCEQKTHAPYALGGTILTPKGPKEGYVIIRDEKIAAIVSDKSQIFSDVKNVVETNGVISPGLVDLHNHVAYNFLPLWKSGRRFNNRYQWARIPEYDTAVKESYNAVKEAKHQCDGLKYGEFRALTGGTTTIQGSVDLGCARSWARNVEFVNFCEDHVRQHVLPINGLDETDAKTLNEQFASGDTKAFFVHLAEGIDDLSRREFEELRALDLLKPQVVGIHSTALSEEQIQEMGQIGMKIVWSPLSNLILYGDTTKIPAALAAGVKVALAPDWTPSGTANLLAEMKIADRVNKERFGGIITDEQLWEMTTKNPAEIAGMDDQLGSIAPGKAADLLIVQKGSGTAYRSIIDAKPSDVLLTVVGGEIFYGEESMVKAAGATREFETVDACGTPRLLSVQEKDDRIVEGSKSLADITGTMKADGVKEIVPLFDCDMSQFDFAFDAEPVAPTK